MIYFILILISWLQIDVDIGSSSVARGIISLVLGYVTSIVVDLAILIEVMLSVSLYSSPHLSSFRFWILPEV